MTGMQWKQVENDDGSWLVCEFKLDGSPMSSRLEVFEWGEDNLWNWNATLFYGEQGHELTTYGENCLSESKAKHMAMHLVAALLQILDGVKPHDID